MRKLKAAGVGSLVSLGFAAAWSLVERGGDVDAVVEDLKEDAYVTSFFLLQGAVVGAAVA